MGRRANNPEDIPSEVWDPMSGILTPRGIEKWWVFPNAFLDGRTPAEAWAAGDRVELRDVIEGYFNPSFT